MSFGPGERSVAYAAITRGLVALVFGVSPQELVSASRSQARVAFARQVAMYLTHVVFGISLARVGAAFGRDRTTASHACRVIEQARENEDIDEVLDRVAAALRALARPPAARSRRTQ
jgi:chromosomal replication initiation ATPase DnaA